MNPYKTQREAEFWALLFPSPLAEGTRVYTPETHEYGVVLKRDVEPGSYQFRYVVQLVNGDVCWFEQAKLKAVSDLEYLAAAAAAAMPAPDTGSRGRV